MEAMNQLVYSLTISLWKFSFGYRSVSGFKFRVSASAGQAYFEENACGKLLLPGTGHQLVVGNAGLGQSLEVLLGALYASENFVSSGGEIDELAGHSYLYLKEQFELPTMPPSSILHGTIIDQFITCGRPGEKAHELASKLWLAVIDNLEENHRTFLLLKRLAQEGELFLPFPYSRSYKVLWKVFDKLFTDFRDCFSRTDYYDMLASAKSKFQPVPSTWLGH